MANHDLNSYIVSYRSDSGVTQYMQFWGEDAAHAGEQMDDAEPGCEVLLVETQAEHEARTGVKLDY